MFGPNSGLCRQQGGTSIFSQGSLALSCVLGSAPFPPPLARLCPALCLPPPGPRGPGYMPRPLARPDRGIDRSDPMDRAGSAGRVRRTRPTAESKAAARRRSGWARSARSQIAGYSEARKATSRRLLRRKPERRRVCALQTRCPGASDRPPPPRFCFPRFYPPNSRAATRLPEGGEDISQGQGRARQGGPRPLESWAFFDTRALTGREDHAERPIALKPSTKVRRRAFIERAVRKHTAFAKRGPLDLHDLSDAALPAPAPGRGRRLGGPVSRWPRPALSGPALPRGTRG